MKPERKPPPIQGTPRSEQRNSEYWIRLAKQNFPIALRWSLHGCAILFIGFLCLRICEELLYYHLHTPKEVKNIRDFRQWKPSLRKAQVVTFHGSTYYAVKGPHARLLASGPSEYYFDHNGNYVGRNVDTGDFYEPAIFSAKDAQRKPIEIDDIPRAALTP